VPDETIPLYLDSPCRLQGESIAWHIQQTLGIREYKRVTFNEITQTRVREGLANARRIDGQLVASQECRRVLDRLVGYLVTQQLRRILGQTIPNARVWVLNGPDTLVKLLKLRDQSRQTYDGRPEFFILGRVRMRMGLHWRLACGKKRAAGRQLLAACPDCGQVLEDLEGNLVTVDDFERGDRRRNCTVCNAALWTLMRPGKSDGGDRRSTILKSMCRIPTIGPVRAERLLNDFGEDFLASMLVDNVSEFINLMDAKGNFVFSDRQAKRMERAMANIEFGFGEGGYQPTEFIKRYRRQCAAQLPGGVRRCAHGAGAGLGLPTLSGDANR